MRYTPLKAFQSYTNVYDNEILQKGYLESAESIIESYLGYSVIKQLYSGVFNGNGGNTLFLKAKPVRTIESITIDGGSIDPALFYTDSISEKIIYTGGVFTKGNRNVTVTYYAGFDMGAGEDIFCEDSCDEEDGAHLVIEGGAHLVIGGTGDTLDDKIYIPKIIKTTALRIAALLQAEADSNIGVSSKSFGDSGTRTFINYTDFSKYLFPLSKYKLLVI